MALTTAVSEDAAADAGGEAGGAADGGASPCQEMRTRCALVDQGTGAIHTCVTTGMLGDAVACQATLASCKKSCGAALCQRIGTICHDKDETCHEMGHEGVPGPCFDRAPACFELCK